VANRLVSKIMMNEVKDLVGKVSQSNHYLVSFSALNPQITEHLGGYLGIRDPINFLSRKSGLLCSDAVLPTTSYATGEVKDNFMGIPQEFAHTRLYTDIDFSFYIDTDYTNLRLFEGWMDFISSGSLGEIGELTDNYYKRYRYPDEYKVQTMFISKFEKNISSQIDYQFINAFPKTMTTIPVSYGDAELLKVNVTFNYDRYVVNPKGSYTTSNLSSFTFTDVERTLFRPFDRINSYASNIRKEVKIDDSNKSDNAVSNNLDAMSFKDSIQAGESFVNDNPDLKYNKDLGSNFNIDFNDQSGLSTKDAFKLGNATGGGKVASDNNQKPSEEKMSGLEAVIEIVNPFSDLNKEQRSKKSKATGSGLTGKDRKEFIKQHVKDAKSKMPLPF